MDNKLGSTTMPKESFTTFFGKNIKANAMYIVFFVIVLFFNSITGGIFLTANNISNLINQAGYIAVLAIGMTLVLIIVNIDLSVGFVAGCSGAVAALLLRSGMHVAPVIVCVLLFGLLVGIYQGVLVAYVGIPAFVVTLAGMFIFRGLLLLLLQKSGTIIVTNQFFNFISNGFVPDFFHGSTVNIFTIVFGIVFLCCLIFSQFRDRRNKIKYNFQVVSAPIMAGEIIIYTVVIGLLIAVLAGYNGIPSTAIIVMFIVLVYNFMLNKTKLGRAIYGVGGNAEAALLSGINVKRVVLFCFCSMGVLSSLAGILYTSRLQSAAPAAGLGFELDAIASSYIGGVAVSGGVGKVTNTIIGVLIIVSLTNGMNLLGVDAAFQYIVKGMICIAAVAFDVLNQKKAK